ncbi:M24 family metallopeptidase [Agromyces sp. CFH 90414]|uniref:Xaa-Pro aminopeptidase n=1 Tax=Agromyces agglutinans TaxID=2662258 RepID=A0A6I2FFS2_9MICO|nr:aminopeptidase P family protein [Agromyces agglutinans]MRG60763.1 M24 family metallopeptidase [Agromyces agglutinans]
MSETTDTSTAPAEPALDEIPAEESDRNTNRSTTPGSERFKEYVSTGWAERDEALPPAREQASYAALRRSIVSAAFPGQRLIIPAGEPKQRANDTDYPYRAHSAFAHLTGWGSDSEPGAVLVLEPEGGEGHLATVYFRERAGRDSDEFYANPAIGEFWIGPRPSLGHVAADLAVATRDIRDLDDVIARVDTSTLVLREADAALTERVDHARIRFAAEEALSTNAQDAPFSLEVNGAHEPDAELARVCSELRLVKDEYEIGQMRAAVDATGRGFTEVLAELPRITSEVRGERVIEGVFATRARLDGNDVGYASIAAAGPHATILHWTRNDGPVVPGDLVLLDAGVELDSYYTADITRTFPVNGTFSAVQRQVYEAVREAADAAFAIVRPGAVFRDVHAAAMRVIAEKTAEWGFLPVSAAESLEPENQFHRRYMVHGTSHHLGLDVHDCAQARRELYLDGVLEAGMVFTIEPGLYFQPDDLTVPAEFRGIGVRIEDDILVTADGAENLSAAIPRTADEVEAWVRSAQA